jgi:hypothetical protein
MNLFHKRLRAVYSAFTVLAALLANCLHSSSLHAQHYSVNPDYYKFRGFYIGSLYIGIVPLGPFAAYQCAWGAISRFEEGVHRVKNLPPLQRQDATAAPAVKSTLQADLDACKQQMGQTVPRTITVNFGGTVYTYTGMDPQIIQDLTDGAGFFLDTDRCAHAHLEDFKNAVVLKMKMYTDVAARREAVLDLDQATVDPMAPYRVLDRRLQRRGDTGPMAVCPPPPSPNHPHALPSYFVMFQYPLLQDYGGYTCDSYTRNPMTLDALLQCVWWSASDFVNKDPTPLP